MILLSDKKDKVISLLNKHNEPARKSIDIASLDGKVRKSLKKNRAFAKDFTLLMYGDPTRRNQMPSFVRSSYSGEGAEMSTNDQMEGSLESQVVKASPDTYLVEEPLRDVKEVSDPQMQAFEEKLDQLTDSVEDAINSQSPNDKTVTLAAIIEKNEKKRFLSNQWSERP